MCLNKFAFGHIAFHLRVCITASSVLMPLMCKLRNSQDLHSILTIHSSDARLHIHIFFTTLCVCRFSCQQMEIKHNNPPDSSFTPSFSSAEMTLSNPLDRFYDRYFGILRGHVKAVIKHLSSISRRCLEKI